MTETKTETKDAPVFLKGLKRSRNPRFGQRRIKMLRPICDECEPFGGMWWLNCDHDPYIGVGEHRTTVPIYSKEPLEDGSVVVERMEERASFVTRPNWAEATISMRVNSGQGEERARAKGWIRPEELRSPAYPNGIAQMCEFKGCYWQHDLLDTRFGVFCKEIEAKRVAQDATDTDGNLLFGATEVLVAAKAQKQLDEIVI